MSRRIAEAASTEAALLLGSAAIIHRRRAVWGDVVRTKGTVTPRRQSAACVPPFSSPSGIHRHSAGAGGVGGVGVWAIYLFEWGNGGGLLNLNGEMGGGGY